MFSIKKLKHFNLKYLTSPGAGVFRKQILLDSLFVGNIPFTKNHYHGVGPDILFSLMSTINYSHYGFINKPLAFFRVHENSITIDAQLDKSKALKLKRFGKFCFPKILMNSKQFSGMNYLNKIKNETY